jgi:tetratricopeptide (TPR) repeat protein
MTRPLTIACISLLLLFSGLERFVAAAEATPATITAATSPLLHAPTTLHRYETPTQALLQWYALRDARPTLLLYSNDPLLQSTNPAIQENLLGRLADHDQAALRFDNANPALLPEMTLGAALDADLFSAVYWVMPTSGEMSELSVEAFRTQMGQFGAASDEEVRSFAMRDGVISGTIRGVPFHALHPQATIAIRGPAVVHFDLTFLSPLYKGEIKTPIHALIFQSLKHLRDQRVKALSVSFSYSQVDGKVSLGSRFIGEVFDQVFKQPEILDKQLPKAWQLRANALYLRKLIMAQKARDTLLQLKNVNNDDPSIDYALYKVSRELKTERQAALGHLAKAVQGDPVYALEYLILAPVASEKNRPDEALRVLRLAHEALPDNPLVTLELARALVANGQSSKAEPFVHKLLELNWSAFFYPDMKKTLQQMLAKTGS